MLATVASFSFPHEAHIARAKLESEGIPVALADEHTVSMQWFYSNAIGGVKVQVPPSCAQRAIEILAQDDSDLLEQD